jgi:hypothetical protein
MNFDDRLRQYRNGRFTDHDLTRCTGLSERALRELIKIRAVRTITENVRGRGQVRLCDAHVFKRAAVIEAINQAGFSLGVGGRIAYFLPFHTLLFETCDPCTILLHSGGDLDSVTRQPRLLKKPKTDWFDPDKPARAEPKTDWLVEIYDRRFVGVIYRVKDQPAIFGDLREDAARFVAWIPQHAKAQFMSSAIARLAIQRAPSGERVVDFASNWEDPRKWIKELQSLGYEYEKHDANDDPLRISAAAAVCSPIITTRINVSLAIRKALRRYLGIEFDIGERDQRHLGRLSTLPEDGDK